MRTTILVKNWMEILFSCTCIVNFFCYMCGYFCHSMERSLFWKQENTTITAKNGRVTEAGAGLETLFNFLTEQLEIGGVSCFCYFILMFSQLFLDICMNFLFYCGSLNVVFFWVMLAFALYVLYFYVHYWSFYCSSQSVEGYFAQFVVHCYFLN